MTTCVNNVGIGQSLQVKKGAPAVAANGMEASVNIVMTTKNSAYQNCKTQAVNMQ